MQKYKFVVFTAASLTRVSSFVPLTKYGSSASSKKSFKSQIFVVPTPTKRRDFVSNSILNGLVSQILIGDSNDAVAGDDLTSQMFNEDGSLKDGAVIEAKDQRIPVSFPSSSDAKSALVSIDGSVIGTENNTACIKASYTVPEKWTAAPDYLDTLLAVREKVCDRIVLYQVPGVFNDFSVLEKASTIGVAKALGFNTVEKGTFPKSLPQADIVSGRKVNKIASSKDGEEEKRKYYEFDLAVAPDTCGSSAENLGLGFCPYDTIVLLSATIINGKMMVCGVMSTKDEWKRANADLKRVRNSFFVERN